MYSNYKKWKLNRVSPIYILSDKPYTRIYTNWVWNPKQGWYGFYAEDKK